MLLLLVCGEGGHNLEGRVMECSIVLHVRDSGFGCRARLGEGTEGDFSVCLIELRLFLFPYTYRRYRHRRRHDCYYS